MFRANGCCNFAWFGACSEERHALSPLEIMFKCHACLLDHTEDFERKLTHECFLPMKDEILAVKKEITYEFSTSSFEVNSSNVSYSKAMQPLIKSSLRSEICGGQLSMNTSKRQKIAPWSLFMCSGRMPERRCTAASRLWHLRNVSSPD